MLEINQDTRTAFAHVRNLNGATRAGIRQGLYNLGQQLRRDFNQAVLAKDKTGRIYRIRRGRKIIRHQASALGETPANITGNYRRSADFLVQGWERLEWGNSADYAGYLEDDPRPGLRNALQANYRNGRNYIESGIASKL